MISVNRSNLIIIGVAFTMIFIPIKSEFSLGL